MFKICKMGHKTINILNRDKLVKMDDLPLKNIIINSKQYKHLMIY